MKEVRGIKGIIAFAIAIIIVLVVLVFALNVFLLLIPVAIVIALLGWLLSLFYKKKKPAIVRVYYKKF